MSLLDTIISTLAPYNCLCCGSEGQLLCATCSDQMPPVDNRCYRCLQPSLNFLTCGACGQNSSLCSAKVATEYSGNAKALLWELKFSGAQSAARIMARRLAALAKQDTTVNTVVVPVPTATSRARRRGYDQAKLLARALARETRLPYQDCLIRSGQAHQHKLSRQVRLQQLTDSFRVCRPRLIRRAHVILVDDVITTGATFEAAAVTLGKAGTARVDAVAFARPVIK